MATINIIDMRWFKGKGTVGVILVKGKYTGYRAYLGVGLDINEDYDAHFIVQWGNKLPRSLAMAYFPKKIKEGVLYDGKTYERPKGRRNAQKQQPETL